MKRQNIDNLNRLLDDLAYIHSQSSKYYDHFTGKTNNHLTLSGFFIDIAEADKRLNKGKDKKKIQKQIRKKFSTFLNNLF